MCASAQAVVSFTIVGDGAGGREIASCAIGGGAGASVGLGAGFGVGSGVGSGSLCGTLEMSTTVKPIWSGE
jgi:hypothetical protein